MRILTRLGILLGTAACAADYSSSPPASTNHTVDVVTSGETFLPTILGITAGDTVRWTFSVAADGLGHNVLFKPAVTGAPADIPKEVRSGTMTRVFNTRGEFNYVCDLHGSMTAKVIVQ